MGRELILAAWRAIIKNRRGSITNIAALAIGIASVLFVANLLMYEMSYDREMDGIFRVEVLNDEIPPSPDAYSPSSLGPTLAEKAGDPLTYARLIPFSEYRSAHLRYLSGTSGQPVYFRRVYYADPEVLNFFRVELLSGEPEAFGAPGSMIISESAALELFGPDWKAGSAGAVFEQGKGFIQQAFQLVGVFADRRENTHLQFDALIAMATPGSGEGSMSGYTYLSGAAIASDAGPDSLHLRPASAIHTSQGVSNEAEAVANRSLLLLLSVVAVIILLITITNYVNSSIINFVDRSREVGIRKLHGASPAHLALRLTVELLAVNLIAAAVGLGLFALGVAAVNNYQLLTYPPLGGVQWMSLGLLLGVAIACNTLLSAVYPIFFLHTIGIIPALKGAGSLLRTRAFGQAGKVVRALLIFQIVSSVVFLSASLIIYRQLQLIDSQPGETQIRITGVFPGLAGGSEKFAQQMVSFFEEMSNTGLVERYSFSNMYKGRIKTEQKLMLDDSTSMYLTVVDPRYLAADSLLAGKAFDYSFGQNPGQIILDSAIAQTQFGFDTESKLWRHGDSRYETMGIRRQEPKTVARGYVSGFRYLTYIDLVLNYRARPGERLDQFLAQTEYVISTKLQHFFLQRREYEASGKAEEEVLMLFVFFGGVSVLVAAIGLFGLSYFVTRKKSREVGIRKIHGASSMQILGSLLADFAWLVLLGGLLAAPLVYFGGNYWLEYYPHRIRLDFGIFLLPVAGIAFITLLSVLNKSWKAATMNPIEVLEDR